jgi:hypothetical protein
LSQVAKKDEEKSFDSGPSPSPPKKPMMKRRFLPVSLQ